MRARCRNCARKLGVFVRAESHRDLQRQPRRNRSGLAENERDYDDIRALRHYGRDGEQRARHRALALAYGRLTFGRVRLALGVACDGVPDSRLSHLPHSLLVLSDFVGNHLRGSRCVFLRYFEKDKKARKIKCAII